MTLVDRFFEVCELLIHSRMNQQGLLPVLETDGIR